MHQFLKINAGNSLSESMEKVHLFGEGAQVFYKFHLNEISAKFYSFCSYSILANCFFFTTYSCLYISPVNK